MWCYMSERWRRRVRNTKGPEIASLEGCNNIKYSTASLQLAAQDRVHHQLLLITHNHMSAKGQRWSSLISSPTLTSLLKLCRHIEHEHTRGVFELLSSNKFEASRSNTSCLDLLTLSFRWVLLGHVTKLSSYYMIWVWKQSWISEHECLNSWFWCSNAALLSFSCLKGRNRQNSGSLYLKQAHLRILNLARTPCIKIHPPPKKNLNILVKTEASSSFDLAGASNTGGQWLSSVTVSTLPGHLLHSITLPKVQHSQCQEPPALTSTHARPEAVQNADPPIWIMQIRRRRRTISQVLFCGAFHLERDFFRSQTD